MSYILEALSKSEQARLQTAGGAKSLLMPSISERGAGQRRWPYVAGAGVAVNALAIYFVLGQRPAPAPVMTASASTSVAVPAQQTADRPSVRDALSGENYAAEARRPVPAESPAKRAPVSHHALSSTASGGLATTRSKPRAAETAAAVPATTAAAPMPQPRPAPVPNALPVVAAAPSPARVDAPRPQSDVLVAAAPQGPDLQRELPRVSVAGFIHEGSTNLAIVNDQLLREGDEVSAGLTLEKILGERVVFNYKGYRFTR